MSSSAENDFTLDSLLAEFGKQQPVSPYAGFSLPFNPFPAAGQFIPGICVNQERIKQELVRTLREFYADGRARRMIITGRTGAGKTNLLRFFEQQFREWREPHADRPTITDLYSIFVREPHGSYMEVQRQIVSQVGALFFTEFYEAVRGGKIDLASLPADLPGTSPELIRILDHVYRPHMQMPLFGPDLQSLRVLDNWLQGVKIGTAEKRQLGGASVDIGKSATVAIRFLADLIRIFYHAKLFRGLIVLFDEFESILSGLSRIDQARYAQDLRNLFDSLPEGIVFVIGTTPINEYLAPISPALARRLGEGISIEPISTEDLALEYARAYIQLGRTSFEKQMDRQVILPEACPEEDRPYYPLTRAMVIEVYGAIQVAQGSVVPGDFLPELNLRLYRRVYEGT
jgi:hypothetical protein